MEFSPIVNGDPMDADVMMANLVDRMPRDSTGELTDEEGNLGSEEARYNELFVKKSDHRNSGVIFRDINGGN